MFHAEAEVRTIAMLTAVMAILASADSASAQAVPVAPQIVARIHLTGQTGPIPVTAIFTPVTDGLFRLSGVFVITTASNQAGNWSTSIGYTADSGSGYVQWIEVASERVNGGFSESTLTVRDNAGNPLTYLVFSTGNPQGSTYELFFTVERLE